jgi:hypothetical protein
MHGTVVDRSLYHQYHTTHDKIQQQYTIVYQKRSQKPTAESPKKVLTTNNFFSRDKTKKPKKMVKLSKHDEATIIHNKNAKKPIKPQVGNLFQAKIIEKTCCSGVF